MNDIRRGEVYWANLGPTRPCVVVSNDIANRFSPLITIVPITTQKLDRVYPHEVSLSSLENLKNSKVKVHQIRTIDKKRIGKKLLTLPLSVMEKVDWALANHLDLVE